MTAWRFAWCISGVVVWYLSGNYGFLLFGALILLIEHFAEAKGKGHRIKGNSAWYAFWWVAYSLAAATTKHDWTVAVALLVCFAITSVAIEKHKSFYRKKTSQKHK